MFVYHLVVVVVNERQLNLSAIVDGPTVPLSASPKLWVSIFQFIIINCSGKIIILYHLKKASACKRLCEAFLSTL